MSELFALVVKKAAPKHFVWDIAKMDNSETWLAFCYKVANSLSVRSVAVILFSKSSKMLMGYLGPINVNFYNTNE